jgi:hypothetical protein
MRALYVLVAFPRQRWPQVGRCQLAPLCMPISRERSERQLCNRARATPRRPEPPNGTEFPQSGAEQVTCQTRLGRALHASMSCCRLRSAPRRFVLHGADFGFFRVSLLELRMSLALEQIIDGYIRLNDRGELAELKAHRENLLVQLRGGSKAKPIHRHPLEFPPTSVF